eukprot:5041168-Amphidinium_carterae.1
MVVQVTNCHAQLRSLGLLGTNLSSRRTSHGDSCWGCFLNIVSCPCGAQVSAVQWSGMLPGIPSCGILSPSATPPLHNSCWTPHGQTQRKSTSFGFVPIGFREKCAQ